MRGTDVASLDPIVLGANYPAHTYPGGGMSARFRGADPGSAPEPEDWVASVTTRWQEASSGLSRLPDGRLLRDAIEVDPEAYLGPEHVAAYGSDPGLLVKLLDSAERLIVHCHPNREFARAHLGCAHGKTEAWLVVDADPRAQVHLAFQRSVERHALDAWVAEQRVDDMLSALHVVPVRTGSALLVPAGVPHAIGPGILVIELQEPSDFTIALEHRASDGGDLGLGPDLALSCVDREAWSADRLEQLSGPRLGAEGSLLPPAASSFFRAERALARSGGEIGEGYAVLVVVAGSGHLEGLFPARRVAVERGATVLMPYAAGPARASGDLEIVVCRPPAPGAPRLSRPEF
jgi:mannose-6-phosphate isomerase